jgi:hypothetical protein
MFAPSEGKVGLTAAEVGGTLNAPPVPITFIEVVRDAPRAED